MNARNKNKNQKPNVVPIKPKWWETPFFRMVLHVVQTTAVALVIGFAAFVLNCFAEWLQAHHASEFLVQTFHVLENALLVIDVVWVLVTIIMGIINEWFDE